MEITLKNVGYRYKNKKVLDHINLKITKNHITGMIGEYKTLLCEIMDAIHLDFTGNITIGEVVLNKENLRWVRKEVALIQQNWQNQFFTTNIKDEMLFLVSSLKYEARDINRKMTQSLEMVGLDKSYLDRNMETLSSGEKKLLQVAIGILCNPSVIIFDEPFVELDSIHQKKMIKLIKALKDKYHKTVIITSNNCDLLYEITDDIIILKKGHILAADKTTRVYQNIELLIQDNIDIPELVKFTMLARKKRVKLSYHTDIRDLIKDVYKHV